MFYKSTLALESTTRSVGKIRSLPDNILLSLSKSLGLAHIYT
jgi:hypothetical protein